MKDNMVRVKNTPGRFTDDFQQLRDRLLSEERQDALRQQFLDALLYDDHIQMESKAPVTCSGGMLTHSAEDGVYSIACNLPQTAFLWFLGYDLTQGRPANFYQTTQGVFHNVQM